MGLPGTRTQKEKKKMEKNLKPNYFMKKIITLRAISILSTFALADGHKDPRSKDLSIRETDKKPGRYFEDQTDVTDDYQIHLIYFLGPDEKDREYDINGKAEKIISKANEK